MRLDLYVTDDAGAVYNVEVQTSNKRNLPKRMRYYQSIIDISILTPVKSSEERRLEYMLLVTRDNEMRAEGRAEGRVEGEIIGAIKLYNDELGLIPEEIVSRIAERFSLEKNVAERYVGETLPLSGND